MSTARPFILYWVDAIIPAQNKFGFLFPEEDGDRLFPETI